MTEKIGIAPGPQKIETYLDACLMADRRRIAPAHIRNYVPNAQRQYEAFRARILKVFAQQREDIKELGTALDMVIADVEEQSNEIGKKNATIERLRRNNATFADAAVLGIGFEEKDARIAELEKRIDVLRAEYDYLLDGSTEAQDDNR